MTPEHIYRITYVNPALAPRPSHTLIEAADEAAAIAGFWRRTNPACVLKTVGDKGICRVELLPEGGAA